MTSIRNVVVVVFIEQRLSDEISFEFPLYGLWQWLDSAAGDAAAAAVWRSLLTLMHV